MNIETKEYDNHFGKYLAAKKLMEEILPEYLIHPHVVSSLLSNHAKELRNLMVIKDLSLRITIIEMWHKHFIDLVENKAFPRIVKNHIRSIGISIKRDMLRETKIKQQIQRRSNR